jgi:hypothetical protein
MLGAVATGEMPSFFSFDILNYPDCGSRQCKLLRSTRRPKRFPSLEV